MDDDELERFLADAASAPPLGRAEEQELAAQAAAGDAEAGSRLVRSNLRLVAALARRYAAAGVPLGELVQEGNLALLQAVERYDPTRGFRFSTYATWWIRRAMGEAIRTYDDEPALTEVQSAWDAFVAHAGRQPTLAELAAETSLSEERLAALLAPPSLDADEDGDDDSDVDGDDEG